MVSELGEAWAVCNPVVGWHKKYMALVIIIILVSFIIIIAYVALLLWFYYYNVIIVFVAFFIAGLQAPLLPLRLLQPL